MRYHLYQNYLFLILIPLVIGCGTLINYYDSTKKEKENESEARHIPEIEFDGKIYKIDGKPVKRVDQICIPWFRKEDQVIQLLDTNEYLYIIGGEYVIGPLNTCICMPNTAMVLTSKGDKQIDDIQIGDSVYTFNYLDGKILQPIIQVNKIPVPKDYIMINITLEDGRSIQASPNHPIPIEKNQANELKNEYKEIFFMEIKTGYHIDNSKVVFIETVQYNSGFTFDILPAGESGYYWAEGILVGSTLNKNYTSQVIK